MSKKKQAPKAAPKQQATPKRSNKALLIAGVVVAVAVVGLIALNNKGGGSGGASLASPEEAKYIGRLLPAGYEEPNIGGAGAGDAQMAPITATDDGDALSVSVADVKANKIVSFEYAKEGADAVPLLAYVKPSGKLFVGVDYCPPCNGLGQDLSGGTLTCRTCGTKREPESGVGISGTCKLYPIDELPVTVDGDKIVLKKADIDSWTPQPLDRPTGG